MFSAFAVEAKDRIGVGNFAYEPLVESVLLKYRVRISVTYIYFVSDTDIAGNYETLALHTYDSPRYEHIVSSYNKRKCRSDSRHGGDHIISEVSSEKPCR